MDTRTLPYIDLGADKDILRQYALEHFGKKISAIAKDETVVDRFQAIYEEETGVKLAPVDKTLNDDDEPDTDGEDIEAVAETKPKAKSAKAKPVKRYPIAATIIVQDDPADPSDVKVGAQFVAYLIKRNVEVRVPMSVLESLKDAKQTHYDPKTMESKDVLSYPFSIVQYHYEGDEE